MVRSSLLVSALFSVVLTAAVGKDKPITIQHPFLWEFQHDGSEVTSYLFGTIHVNDPKITQLDPQVLTAFKASDCVWFEIDFLKDAAAQVQAISLPSGQHLEDLVPGQTVARIDQRLNAMNPLLSRGVLPEFRVVAWPLVLANLEAQMNHPGVQPLDMQLQLLARESKMKTGGLEDATSQLKPLVELTIEKQIEFLNASLDVIDEDTRQGISQLEILVNLYAIGDGDALQKYLENELRRPQISAELKKLFVDTLLIERNLDMVRSIAANIEAAPGEVHFIAVGIAHLLGKGSVVDGLKQAGYTVRRVGVEVP